MTMKERSSPIWMPPANTALAVPAGLHWDAVSVPQQVGLAALSVLDAHTNRRPGPVIWDAGRVPRLYFLIPSTSLVDFLDTAGRRLGSGCHVAIPGPTELEPPGPYWVAPPDPDAPGILVDPELLAEALRRVVGASWADYQPPAGEKQLLLASSDQLHGAACIRCTAITELSPAGYAFLHTSAGEAPLGWPVRACRSCSHGETQ